MGEQRHELFLWRQVLIKINDIASKRVLIVRKKITAANTTKNGSFFRRLLTIKICEDHGQTMIAVEICNPADPEFDQWQQFVFDYLTGSVRRVSQWVVLWQFRIGVDKRPVHVDFDSRSLSDSRRLTELLNDVVVFKVRN